MDDNPYEAPRAENMAQAIGEYRGNERRGWPGWIAVLAIVLFVTLTVAGFFAYTLSLGPPRRF